MPITQIEPYYRTGTASITNGSKAVTGSGTSWLTNAEPGDQFFGLDGRMGIVDTVNSNTSITLLENWPGTTQAGGKYAIYRVPDSVRLENFSQRMVNLLVGQVLTSIGLLDGTGGDKGVMLNGAGSATTFALTSWARSLLDDANVAGFWSTVGEVPLARIPQSLKPDNTAATTVDWNTLTSVGWQTGVFSASGANGPPGSQFFHVQVMNRAGYLAQIAYPYGNNSDTAGGRSIWMRLYNLGTTTWTAWRAVGAPQLGTVFMTSGIPSGANFEYGSNANGSYLKYADGTMVCWHETAAFAATTTAAGSGFQSSSGTTWTFPAAFSAAPVVTASGEFSSVSRSWITLSSVSATVATMFSHGFVSGGIASAHVIAIGRW